MKQYVCQMMSHWIETIEAYVQHMADPSDGIPISEMEMVKRIEHIGATETGIDEGVDHHIRNIVVVEELKPKGSVVEQTD